MSRQFSRQGAGTPALRCIGVRVLPALIATALALAPGGWSAEVAAVPEGADAPYPGAGMPEWAGTPSADGRSGTLLAEREGNRMRVTWRAPNPAPGRTVGAWVSTDAPGHWESRDWRRWAMEPLRGSGGDPVEWQVRVPVASATEPVMYWAEVVEAGVTNVTGLRLFQPAVAGFREPTFPFLGFLEGFEDGMAGWDGPVGDGRERVVGRAMAPLTGRWALRMEVPAGRGSVTVGTVRIRGWMLRDLPVQAVRLAVRTESGSGRLRMALHSRSRTEQLAVHPVAAEPVVGPEWRRVEVPLEAFAGLVRSGVDWFSVQFLAESGRALLVDDVELVLR